jgi:hypothetical protein
VILPDSRYASSTVVVVDDPVRGKHQAINVEPPPERTFAFTYYQVTAGETIDMLADRFMGNGQYWWMLADANPEILDWNNLTPGVIIRVPYV